MSEQDRDQALLSSSASAAADSTMEAEAAALSESLNHSAKVRRVKTVELLIVNG